MNIKDYFKKGFKYATVGFTGALLNWLSLYLFTEYFHLWYIYSAILASLLVMVLNFNLFILWKVIKIE